jgi:hypothetical protein
VLNVVDNYTRALVGQLVEKFIHWCLVARYPDQLGASAREASQGNPPISNRTQK